MSVKKQPDLDQVAPAHKRTEFWDRARRQSGAALFVGGLVISGASLFQPVETPPTVSLTAGSSGASGQTSSGASGQTSSGASGQTSSGASGDTSGGTSGDGTSGTSGQTSSGASGQTSSGASGQTSGTSGQSSGTSGQTSSGASGNTSGGTSGDGTSGQTSSGASGQSSGSSGQTTGTTTGAPVASGFVAFISSIWQAITSFVGGLITAFLGLFFGFRPNGSSWWF